MCKQDCGRDKTKALCSQTENGVSVRAYMTIINFAKALTYFRGNVEVDIQDIRQIIPWILHEKLTHNQTSAFFDVPGNDIYRIDKIAWIRKMFDDAMDEFNRLDLDNNDPLIDIKMEFDQGLEGLDVQTVKSRIRKIEESLQKYSKETKLFNYVYDDVIKLKYYWMRYRNYLDWLEWKK